MMSHTDASLPAYDANARRSSMAHERANTKRRRVCGQRYMMLDSTIGRTWTSSLGAAGAHASLSVLCTG